MSSSVPQLGKLKRLDARAVWRSEPQDFTPWVKANIDTLSEALRMDLELPETEAPVGDFACDVVAQEVGTGHMVIIENQLEPTDHGHLGQVLTYAAGLDARAIVWIAPQFRPEHRQAMQDAAIALGQSVDTCSDHCLHRLRDLVERPALTEGLQQLDQEQWATVRLLRQAAHHSRWQRRIFGGAEDQVLGLLYVEG